MKGLSATYRKERRLVMFFKYFLHLLFAFSLLGIQAQPDNTIYLLHSIPQTNELNPAIGIDCKLYIGLPVLNSLNVKYANSSFTYNQFAHGEQLLLNDVYNGLHRMNYITTDASISYLSAAYREGTNTYFFSVSDRFSSYNSYSRRLAGLMLYGNTEYMGNPVSVNNSRINAFYCREYAAGWAFTWDHFTRFGARAKLLFGKAGVYTGKSRLRIGTDEETYNLSLSGLLSVNSSFPLEISQNSEGIVDNVIVEDDLNYLSLLWNFRNPGLAFDLGVIHKYSNEVTLSASIKDLGFIVWTDHVNNLQGDVDFSYEGVEDSEDLSRAAYFRHLIDSVRNDIIYEVTQSAYVQPLPLNLYFGGTYHWKDHLELGAVVHTRFVNRQFNPALSLSIVADIRKSFFSTLSWTYRDNTFLNFGMGIAFVGRGFQTFLVTESLNGFIAPFDTHNLSIRLGMNLMLGCPRDLSDSRDKRKYKLDENCRNKK